MLHAPVVLACWVLAIFALCGSVYVTVFALIGLRAHVDWLPGAGRTRFLILIPAHNEGSGIRATLRSIGRCGYPGEKPRLVVIADNCDDDTAEQARSCGAEVWVREDERRRGKGHALAWALEKVDFPFDLAAIIDADTEVGENFLRAMDSGYSTMVIEGRAVAAFQGRYLFAKASGRSWFGQFTAASKAAENSFCYRPRTALGLANLIQGNGFCVSREALNQVPFAAFSIVEDVEYAIALALSRVPVIYVDEARVVSRMTRGLEDAAPQRLRWASGTFALLFRSIPLLLRGAIQQRSWKLAEMALMLLLTSRLILIYASAAALVLLALVGWPGIPLWLLAGALVFEAAYLGLVLRKADRDSVSLQAVLWMPLYVGFLGAMQIGALLGWKRRQWNRTVR